MVKPSLLRLAGRVPAIKFRKGGHSVSPSPATSGTQASVSAPGPAKTAAAAAAKTASRPAQLQKKVHVVIQGKPQQFASIEHYDLPLRYRRALLSQAEIDSINSGGAM